MSGNLVETMSITTAFLGDELAWVIDPLRTEGDKAFSDLLPEPLQTDVRSNSPTITSRREELTNTHGAKG